VFAVATLPDAAFVVAVFAVAAFVIAFAAFAFAAAAFVLVFETSWANAAADHATDPNNMAAKPASVCALANLIVFIVAPRCSKMHRENRLFPTIIGRASRGSVK